MLWYKWGCLYLWSEQLPPSGQYWSLWWASSAPRALCLTPLEADFKDTWQRTEVSSLFLILFLFLIILMWWWPSYVYGVVPLQSQWIRCLPPWTHQGWGQQESGCGWKASKATPKPRSANQLQAWFQGKGGRGDLWFFCDLGQRNQAKCEWYIPVLTLVTHTKSLLVLELPLTCYA